MLPSIHAELCITRVHHRRNSSLSSLRPQPLFAGKTRGSTRDCFLWCRALAAPRAHTVTFPRAVGQGHELGWGHREASARPRKGPAAGQCLPWSLLRALRKLCWQLLLRTNREDSTTSFCFLLSQGGFSALLQLYPPGNADFF